MRLAILVFFIFLTSKGMASEATASKYIPCIKKTSEWIHSGTEAGGDGSVAAATRLCIAHPDGVPNGDLECVKNITSQLFRDSLAQRDTSADSAAALCLIRESH